MMQPAIFNRLSSKRAQFAGKLLVFGYFLGTIVLPLGVAHAANFTCTNSAIGATTASLTITESSHVYNITTADFILIEVTTDPGIQQGKTAQTRQSIADYQAKYNYDGLQPNTAYRVAVLNGNKYVEELTACNFTTKGANTPSATQTPATTQANSPSTPASTNTTQTTPVATSTSLFPAAQTGANGLIPCDGPDCDLNSVLKLANNLLAFAFNTLLLPLFIIIVIYMGYSYIAAQGNPGQHAKLASMAKHMVLGLILMLCSWVIVRTIISLLGYTDDLYFFGK